MPRPALDERLDAATKTLVDSIRQSPKLHRLGEGFLPNRETVHQSVATMLQLVFPGYFGRQGLTDAELPYHVGGLVNRLMDELFEPIRYCLRFREHAGDCEETAQRCDAEAERVVAVFVDRLPAVRALCATDVDAHFAGDPAAGSTEEIIFSYPGLLAVTVQRLAHELYKLDVPLLPRIMTEFAHARTGIDIHPGASLGEALFIDHGTGVVVGETCVIGQRCKIYQGVTLGALAPAKGQELRGVRRHPRIGDDVVLYAGATILGGETEIGDRSTVGGNVFLTQSVPPDTRVVAEAPRLKYRNGQTTRESETVPLDFQI
ncbi:MAG: serine O-acetyltransferase [Planctomycetota bacterium]